jgi:hypothetical protein
MNILFFVLENLLAVYIVFYHRKIHQIINSKWLTILHKMVFLLFLFRVLGFS